MSSDRTARRVLMSLPAIAESTIRKRSTEASFDRSREYYRGGYVVSLEQRDTLLLAEVEGSTLPRTCRVRQGRHHRGELAPASMLLKAGINILWPHSSQQSMSRSGSGSEGVWRRSSSRSTPRGFGTRSSILQACLLRLWIRSSPISAARPGSTPSGSDSRE